MTNTDPRRQATPDRRHDKPCTGFRQIPFRQSPACMYCTFSFLKQANPAIDNRLPDDCTREGIQNR
jgi:hypothetical protein